MYEGKPSLSRVPYISLAVGAFVAVVATVVVGVVVSQLTRNGGTLAPNTVGGGGAQARAASVGSSSFGTAAVQSHNNYRLGTLNPPAASMPALQWDQASANVAQSYIDRCPGLAHNGARGSDGTARGENIYVSSQAGMAPETAISNAVTAWFNEAKDYNYATGSCTPGKMCGHYTQVVWADTWGVGCGVRNNCPGPWQTQVVCDYVTPGNYIGRKPYVSGGGGGVVPPPSGGGGGGGGGVPATTTKKPTTPTSKPNSGRRRRRTTTRRARRRRR